MRWGHFPDAGSCQLASSLRGGTAPQGLIGVGRSLGSPLIAAAAKSRSETARPPGFPRSKVGEGCARCPVDCNQAHQLFPRFARTTPATSMVATDRYDPKKHSVYQLPQDLCFAFSRDRGYPFSFSGLPGGLAARDDRADITVREPRSLVAYCKSASVSNWQAKSLITYGKHVVSEPRLSDNVTRVTVVRLAAV